MTQPKRYAGAILRAVIRDKHSRKECNAIKEKTPGATTPRVGAVRYANRRNGSRIWDATKQGEISGNRSSNTAEQDGRQHAKGSCKALQGVYSTGQDLTYTYTPKDSCKALQGVCSTGQGLTYTCTPKDSCKALQGVYSTGQGLTYTCTP